MTSSEQMTQVSNAKTVIGSDIIRLGAGTKMLWG